MKILFLTDSLSLPRDGKDEKVFYEDTYPYLLKKKYKEIDFVFLGIGGATATDLYRQSSYYKGLNADLVFLQCGIVDCAPRPFRKTESIIIKKLKLRFLFKPLVKFLTKYRNYRYSSPSRFNKSTKRIKQNAFADVSMYSIGILPASNEYEKKLPGIIKSINKYNNILKRNYDFIDTSDIPFDGILSDHHHLNKKGHLIIFNKLTSIINKHKV